MALRPDKILTDREFAIKTAAQAEELIALIQRHQTPFADNTPSGKKKRKKRCENSIENFITTYLPHYARVKSAGFHKLMDDAAFVKNELVLMDAFRGSAKTVRLLIAKYLMHICYGKKNLIGIGALTAREASSKAQAIRIEIEENPAIKNDFGELMQSPNKNEEFKANGCTVISLGVGQSPRGLLRIFRLEDFVLDDLFDDDDANSKTMTDKALKWIRSALMPAMDTDGWHMSMLGQPLQHGSVMDVLLNETRADGTHIHYVVNIPSDAGDFKSFWPEKIPDKYLRGMCEKMGSIEYGKNYLLQVFDSSELFQLEWLERCRYDSKTRPDTETIEIAIPNDPSKGIVGNDKSAIIVLGFHIKQGFYYVLDCRYDWLRPKKNVAVTKEFADEYINADIVVESNLFQELLADEIEEQCSTMAVHKPVNLQPKEIRYTRLSGLIERGKIKFDETVGDTKKGVAEIFNYPSLGDDFGDSLELGIRYIKRKLKKLIAGYKSVEKRKSVKTLEKY